MKKIINRIFFPIITCLFISGIIYGQESYSICIGKTETLNSAILGEKREIWIHVPESYTYSKNRYPVVYLLDGDVHFNSVVAMTEFLNNSSNLIPEMIVVGIVNTDRTRDLTPTHMDEALPYLSREAAKTSGGGNAFFNFMEKELIPYIDKNYPTAPYKMLIGHSLGGLTAIEGILNHTYLFNAYVSLDPSLWWNSRELVNQMKTTLGNKKFEGISLYLACANTLENGVAFSNVRKDTSKQNEHIRALLDANDLFNNAKKNGLKYGFKYYSEDNHGSVPMIAEYDAFRFIFDFFKMQLTDDERANWNKEIIARIESHYAVISKKMGYPVLIPEEVINAKAYKLLEQKKYDDAEYLFQLNIRNFPESANAYDSMGDCNLAKGEKDKAIANFKKALSIDSNFAETKAKLDALLKG
ncbi:MAG: alpha/beta hydrolase-fold protein [Flavobacterium sp.]